MKTAEQGDRSLPVGAPDTSWPLTRDHPTLRILTVEASGQDAVALVDPFAAMHDRGGFSRVLLAELVGPGGERIMHVVLKIQSDEYPTVAEAEATVWNNAAVAETWRREAALLDRLRGTRTGVPTTVGVLPRETGEPATLPPTIFCKRRRAFFAAPCPACGSPLADVRDSRALEDRGLPRYDLSLVRFLGCPACAAKGTHTLYTLIRESSAGRDVGDVGDLFRAYGTLARTPIGDDGARLPCQGCEHVPSCHPADGAAGDAVRVLTPLTFYESRCMVMEPLHLRLDEFASLLGGAPFDEVLPRVDPGRALLLRDVRALFTDERQYLFAHDAAGKLALEVLRLKLTVLAQIVRGVVNLHRHTAAPHLGISPARVMVLVPGDRTDLPNLWNFRAVLLGLGNAMPRDLRTGDPTLLPARPFNVPRLIDPIFSAPPLRELPVGGQAGVLTLRQLVAGPDGAVTVHGELASDAVDLRALGDKDVVEVSVVQARPPLSFAFLASPSGAEGPGIRLRSIPTRIDADTRALLDQLLNQPLSRARFNVYPSVDVPCDIYSLGMLSFALLLVNGSQPLAAVARAVADLATETTLYGRDHSRYDDVRDHAASLLRSGGAAEVFGRRQLFTHPERHTEAASQIPDALWTDVLLVALRAVTTVSGFSICRSASDFDPAHREVKAELLLGLVDSLVRQVDAHLFGLPGRQREIRAALARVAEETRRRPGP